MAAAPRLIAPDDDVKILTTEGREEWGVVIGIDGQLFKILVRDDRRNPRYTTYQVKQADVLAHHPYKRPMSLAQRPDLG